MRIGYVGLGAMGGSLSTHLTRGHRLTVYDRNPAAMAALAALGASTAQSPEELARNSDIVLLCLPKSSDVEDALFGPRGVAVGLQPGKMVIDQTSGIPSATLAMSERLARLGVDMLDAPVSGGIPAARAGTVTIIASGSDKSWSAAESVLKAMTPKVFRCSARVGDAQALKLVNNAIGAGYRMTTLELTALARKAGIGLETIVDRLNRGPAANFTSKNMLAGLVAGVSTTNFALALMVKDLNEALNLALETRSAMPMTAAARGIMQSGLHLIGMDARLEDVIPLTEKLAGVGLTDGMAGQSASDPSEVLDTIENATIVCNALAVLECVATGRRFGLSTAEMARILNVGSAWCAVSELLLPALASGEPPMTGLSIARARAALSNVCRLGATLDVPLILPNNALMTLQQLAGREPETSDSGILASGFGF